VDPSIAIGASNAIKTMKLISWW